MDGATAAAARMILKARGVTRSGKFTGTSTSVTTESAIDLQTFGGSVVVVPS
jgi:hypothetical protein